ncbi:MAG TPA: helix-turn-helix domain-containing protein [Negativicutes bacterium]|jgi:sugar diacid utilization regulator
MCLASTSVHLLEGTLTQGLSFVATYLQKMVSRPIIITDGFGKIHYPAKKSCNIPIDNVNITTLPTLSEEEYYYNEAEGNLFYQLGQNNVCAIVIVKHLPQDLILQTIGIISEGKLAIKNYFINIDKIRKSTEKFANTFAENLFIKSSVNIMNIIKMSEIDLDINKPYFIAAAQIDKADNEIDLQLIRVYTLEYMKKMNLEIFPISWRDCLMFIIPAMYKEDTLARDQEWPRLNDGVNWKKALDCKFNIIASTSWGQVYRLRDLHKSYNEARIAMTLPKLMGKEGFVQRFCDLGVFSHMFSQDVAFLKSYCIKILGGIMEYDRKNQTKLLPALRMLLDNCCNWKATADSLFIHVNTLHYQVAKIEHLFGVDLSKMDSRTNLFTAIKVWDTLRILGFIEEKQQNGQYCRAI